MPVSTHTVNSIIEMVFEVPVAAFTSVKLVKCLWIPETPSMILSQDGYASAVEYLSLYYLLDLRYSTI
jgi:hypothetical protein